MKIEVLIAIKPKSKKGILGILSSMRIDSDARIAVYHYNEAQEERFDYHGHSICVHYIAAETKIAAYDKLLKLTDADAVILADSTQAFVPNYKKQVESALAECPGCDGVLFGAKRDGKRVGIKEAKAHSLSALCLRTFTLCEHDMSFVDFYDDTYATGAINVFRHEVVAWPSRFVGKASTILVNDEPTKSDEANNAFYDSHRIGFAWLMASIVRFLRTDKQKRTDLKNHFRNAKAGHEAYCYRKTEDNPAIKDSAAAFFVSVISMLGLAVQLILSLLIAFTEVQYIPIWVSLIFLVLYAIIYAVVSPKVRNTKAVLIVGITIGLLCFFGALITYLLMNVSWAMSIYGGFICLVIVLGLTYCFAPHRPLKIRT